MTASKSRSSSPTPVAPVVGKLDAMSQVAGRQRIGRRGVTTNSLAATRECRGRKGVRSSSAREGGRPGADATEPTSVSGATEPTSVSARRDSAQRRDSAHLAGGRAGGVLHVKPVRVGRRQRTPRYIRSADTSALQPIVCSQTAGATWPSGHPIRFQQRPGGRALRIVVCDARARASGGPVTAGRVRSRCQVRNWPQAVSEGPSRSGTSRPRTGPLPSSRLCSGTSRGDR